MRTVAILLFGGVEVLDFAGPFEVFSVAGNGGRDLQVVTVAETRDAVTASGGLTVVPKTAIGELSPPDILVVPGGRGTRTERHNEALVGWLREICPECKVVLSVCTGALLLAAAGLLDGRRATTHLGAIDELRQMVPETTDVVEDVRFVDNGDLVVAAGVSAGIDGALHVVSRLWGEGRAKATAQRMEYRWEPGA